jgi:two-component system, sensor histidine kinase RpfC
VDNTANTVSGTALAVKRVFHPLKGLRARLKARTDSEHEQAILRIVIVSLVVAYMGFTYSPDSAGGGHAEPLLVFGLAADLVLAIALFVAICVWPAPSIRRRATGMLADAGAATFCMFLAGESGVAMIGVYLFITFGNGFRYGRAYLFACQALCILGFLAVLFYAPYWEIHRVAGWCLMIALVVLPLYVSTLLKKILEARARAEEANRAKTSFLANMSHEMRTPLNGIVGVADLLQTTSVNAQQAELMRLLRHSVMLLRSLVDDVLDISKIEAGRLTIEIADFDLHATLNGLIRLLRQHAQAKGLALHAMVDPAIDYHLRGDSHHLRQVLLNLLSNAIKFTERGEIGVEVTLLAETEEGLRLRFEVRDTGIGISDAVQQRIFERFVQADDSTTRRYGGTGLGTTIAKQLVELMGGVIGLKSALGKGSTFWFELPLLKTVSGSPLLSASIEAESQAKPTAAILIAEPPVKVQVATLVEAACGRVEIVTSGDAAVAQLRALRQQDISVSAVIVSADPDTAFDVFDKFANQHGDSPTAMIYLSRTTPSDFSLARLRSIDGVSCLNLGVSPRLLRNAIHAATTGGMSESAQIIDLGQVLQEQRQPLRILVAEDNVTNQTIIRKLLESAGHTVLLASDGEQALDLYEEGNAELAILDFNMPERNGLEVVTTIRTMEPTGTRLPVIILSASVTTEARERARQAGADEFVGKPFEAAALLQVIDRLARRAGRGQQVRPRHATPGQASTIALIDHARMQEVERISRDAAFLMQLLGGFRSDVESLLARLDSAIAAGQRVAMTDIAHTIRGAALGIGAQQLAAQCVGIEEAASGGHIGQLRNLAAEMRRCFDATAAQLNDYTIKKGAS